MESRPAPARNKGASTTTGSPCPTNNILGQARIEKAQGGIWSFLAMLQASIDAQNQEITKLALECQALESKNVQLEQIVEEHSKKIAYLQANIEKHVCVEAQQTWAGVVANASPGGDASMPHDEGSKIKVDNAWLVNMRK